MLWGSKDQKIGLFSWGAARPLLKTAIAAKTSQLKLVEKAGDEIKLKMQGCKDAMKETIDFLKTEMTIIVKCQEEVENVQDTVSQFNAQELIVLKEVFIEGIDDLQASAQAFLDQPDNVFGT